MHCETRDPVISSSPLQGPHEHAAAKHDRPTRKLRCLLVQRGDHRLYGGFAPRRLPALCSCCKNPTARICTRAEEQWEGRLETQHLCCAGRRMQPGGNIPTAKLCPSRRRSRSRQAADPLLTPPRPQKVSGVCPAQIRPAARSTAMLCSPGASVPVDY